MYIYMSVSRYMYIIHFHLSICIKYLARQHGGGESCLSYTNNNKSYNN